MSFLYQRILLSLPLVASVFTAVLAHSAFATPATEPFKFYIREYRVQGAYGSGGQSKSSTPPLLSCLEVETAVYPFLGPGRTADDVEQARAALEKAYKDKGFQTVSVEIPEQKTRGGIVLLKVNEPPVGRLRVHGSRYYSLEDIKAKAPSLAEGTVPNFNDVQRDIVRLNQLADRRVTPVLRAGVIPGTVDIDLQVKDTPPLHGNIELNNRYSENTTQLRINGSVSYNNLWQLGHSIGGSFQIAPERPDDAKVFSAYYLARIPHVDWLSLTLQGTKQDSNVSTLASADSVGRGETAGLRAAIALPPGKDFYQSASLGIDYKHSFNDTVTTGPNAGLSLSSLAPGFKPEFLAVTYYPVSASYNGTWAGKGYETDLNADLTLCLRMAGQENNFEWTRYKADNNFVYLRGDLSHRHDLPLGLEIFGKVQGQLSDQALISNEQFGAGGLSTVRGYLESAALGDNAICGTLELRSPSLLGRWNDKIVNEWRVYTFLEGAALTLIDALPEQQSRFDLASLGFGTRLRLLDHVNGSIDVGFPLINQTAVSNNNPVLTFRAWAEF